MQDSNYMTMAQWRATNMYPSEESLLFTDWELPDTLVSKLEYYFLRDFSARYLSTAMSQNNGHINLMGMLWYPILQNMSRAQLREGPQTARYIVSFRKLPNFTPLAIVQPKHP